MKSLVFYFLVISALVFSACGEELQTNELKLIEVKELELNSASGCCSNLSIDDSGKPFLSWIEYLSDTTDALMFSSLDEGLWSPPREIAQGNNWFVNWADFPALAIFSGDNRNMAAHWLQKSTEGIYDYDVRVSTSEDRGATWNPSFVLHRDSIAAEHGFVSLMPHGTDRVFATWLDGRFTKKENGAMTLRSAEFDSQGNLYKEFELDNRVCDCCQTDAAITSNGPVVVYRDRSEDEIRDIYIVRQLGDRWSVPEPVFSDNWKVSGCPVNGPAVVADGATVAVAWFAAAENQPTVKVAFSGDAGDSFDAPIRLDNGNPLGRVDLVWLDKNTVLVSWLEKTENSAEIRLQAVTAEGPLGESQAILETSHSRESGFPILAKTGDRLFLSHTAVDSVGTRVKTAELLFK